jgi:uncharacterized phiE125 gp8 family phage protein
MTIEYKRIGKVEKNIISLDQVKDFIRLSGDDENSMIQLFIDAAVKHAEGIMNRDLLTATYECYRPSFNGDLTLRRAPYQSLVSIEYLKDSTYTTLLSSEYKLSEGGIYGIIEQIETPTVDDDVKGVKITFKSGYGDNVSDVPADITMALLQTVHHWYDNRGICGCPDAVNDIYDRYKVIDISYEL